MNEALRPLKRLRKLKTIASNGFEKKLEVA